MSNDTGCWFRKCIIPMYPLLVDNLSFSASILKEIFGSPSYFTSDCFLKYSYIFFWISLTPETFPLFIQEWIFSKYSWLLTILDSLLHSHKERISMKHISHQKYSCFLHVSKRNKLFGKPLKKFISSFTSFHGLKILDIVCDNKFWAIISMSHTSCGLIDWYNCDSCLRTKKYDRRRIKFISIFSKWSEILFEKFIIENFFFEISHVELCLSLGLSNNDNKFELMVSKNAPERKSCINNRRFPGSSKCHDSCKASTPIFDKVKNFLVEPCHRGSNIMSKVDLKKELETFFSQLPTNSTWLFYSFQISRSYTRLWCHNEGYEYIWTNTIELCDGRWWTIYSFDR